MADVRAGRPALLVEQDAGHLAGDVRLELHAQLERLPRLAVIVGIHASGWYEVPQIDSVVGGGAVPVVVALAALLAAEEMPPPVAITW